ncbi:MAG: M28 family peptidase [Chloroflexi bacterium]|nr:M28 family peptidase [Chloroflexota bacterium]
MLRHLSRRTFIAAAAMATAACGAAVQSSDLPQAMIVAAGDEPQADLLTAGADDRQLRASLMADTDRLARLEATSSLRTSALGTALVRSIDGLGLDAERREFLALGRGLPSVSLRVDGDFFLASGMIYSAVGVVEGPLRQADVNDEGMLRGSGYDGAVVLVARGVTPFRVIGRLLEDAGAAAVVVYNNRPGLLYGTLSQPSGIPVVSVTEEAGEDLLERLERGVPQAVVDVSPPQRTFQGANVIGHRAGPLRRQIVVATPADTPLGDYSNGGNADGLALLLALARHADRMRARHSISFVAFDATHRGYLGSRWYLAHLSDDERASIDAVLAFDRPGRSHPLQLAASDELARLMDQRLEADGVDLRVTPHVGVGRGDHDVFAARGVPYVFLARDGPGQISADDLLSAFHVAAAALETLDGFAPSATS